MRIVFILLLWLVNFAPVTAQTNIVPNPGFEKYASQPLGWTYKGATYGEVVKYWFSATTASPDIYGPGVRVPVDWSDKGFGKEKPRSGKCMTGLTLWGCTNGKPHCREFIEIQLAEPLVVGQTYYVEFWVTPLARSLYINQIGAYFSVGEVKRSTDELLVREAQVRAEKVVRAKKGQWAKISGYFEAKYEAEYVLIGNFTEDNLTLSEVPAGVAEPFNYAYYYVDDVLVKKSPPYKPVPVKPDDLSLAKLEKGKTFQLKNIYFEFDKDELMPRSHVELNKLLKIMRDNPKLSIEIVGHTDKYGNDAYNLNLSKRRAQSVVDFLTQNKISATRLRSRGEGESKPVASNDTDEGRAQNRRVEFIVLKM